MTTDQNLRNKVHNLLHYDASSKVNRAINLFLILLIVSNVIAVVIESYAPLGKAYKNHFYLFELFSIFIFTIEYLSRIWTCVEIDTSSSISHTKQRLKYFFTPLAIIDLIAIVPFYLSLFFAIDLRYLRLLRVLRLLKLSHYFKGIDVFISVLIKESLSIATAIATVIILVIISASLMYTLEHDAQPEVFSSIPHSLWWAVVTMTTVGYGDVTPITLAGKTLAGFIMLLGVGIVALPAGMLAARFGEELQSRKDKMRAHVLHALQDGVVDDNEQLELEIIADELGLSIDALNNLINNQKFSHNILTKCPHCGNTIDKDLDELN